jgi:hypothetical protein
MPSLTDEEREQLADLLKRHAEAEKEVEEAEKESKEAEAEKRKAIAQGGSEKRVSEKREEAEIARMSESSAAALLERMDAMMALLEETLREKGVKQEEIEQAKRGERKRLGRR